MVNLSRHRVALTGFPGGPGVATYYSLDAVSMVASLQTMWTGFATSMPLGVQVQVENSGDVIDEATGDIVTAWLNDPVAPILATKAGGYSAPSGLCVTWRSDTIVHNHRLRGRTFIVPLSGDQYQSDGSLIPALPAAIRTLADDFIAAQSTSFVVWSRPFKGTPAAPGRAANPARAGSHGLVTSSSVADKAAVLRSRRD